MVQNTTKSGIPAFIINLKHRLDRRESIQKQFKKKDEFIIEFVEPIKDDNSRVSLWKTIVSIIENNISKDFLLICEDDHIFTDRYNSKKFLSLLNTSKKLEFDLLSGGVSAVRSTFRISEGLYWMDDFTGLQFTVIFKRLFQQILEYKFLPYEDADIVISKISENKAVLYPFISSQREFGYSDVTKTNEIEGRLGALFEMSSQRIGILDQVHEEYTHEEYEEVDFDLDHISIPTYILQEADNKPPLKSNSLIKQFAKKSLFDITISFYSDYKREIEKIIRKAVENNDDLIIICSPKVTFNDNYTNAKLLKAISIGFQAGAEILLGDILGFDSAVLVTEEVFWLSSFVDSNFIVIFRDAYNNILEKTINVEDTNHLLSQISTSKFGIHPFLFGILPDQNHIYGSEGHIEAKRKLGYATSFHRLTRTKNSYRKFVST